MSVRHPSDEHGSGSVLALAVVAAMLVLAGVVLPAVAALATRQLAANAADAAALATADTASGLVPGIPCENAQNAARMNGTSIVTCSVGGSASSAGLEATVTVERTVMGIPVTATARAGPPPGGPAGTTTQSNDVVR